jgi:2-desacetyl-2-hydroxyethyl bacteriochlorophyllide A dehydrogenase
MYALVCHHPGELSLEQRPDPARGDGEVLVRPRRVGLCGTDYHIFEGKHPFLSYPRVMGHELAVEVIEAPEGAQMRAGDICAVNPYLSCGTCIACRAGKTNCCTRIAVLGVHRDGGMSALISLPIANLVVAQDLGLDECAAVEFLSIGAHAVRRAGPMVGQQVLVVGAGPIGLGVALFARLEGGAVTMMDLDADRLAAAKSIAGAAALPGGDQARQNVADCTRGDGFDVVFDATGSASSMQQAFDFVAPGGRYVLVSVVKGPITFEDPDFHRKELTLFASRNAVPADFQRVILAMREGRVPVDRLVTHRTTLLDAVRDLPIWAVQKGGLIKAIISTD